MADAGASDLIDLARDLERQDLAVAARIDGVATVSRRVDDIRESAMRVRAGLEALPGEIEQAERAEGDARAREEEARSELAKAEGRLGEVERSRRTGNEARADAERALRRATVAAADAAGTVARMHERLLVLRGDEVALRTEAEGLAGEAAEVSRALADVPRLSDSGRATPGRSLFEIEEWGARAHAALFVVRGGLESERERIVYEANALATAALGEQVAGASVALVRRRLEETLAGR